MSLAKLKTVALLARQPGLRVLEQVLADHDRLEILRVYTHARLTKAEGGGPRPEFVQYQAVCDRYGIGLIALDGPEGRRLADHLPSGQLDLLVSLSWRNIVSPIVLDRISVAAINLHRGDLPAFAGAEPVRQAIEAGMQRVAITAHQMVEKVDAGKIFGQVWIDIPLLPVGMTSAQFAEVIKEKLVPLYPPLARLAIAAALA